MCGYCGAPLVAGGPPPEIRRTVTIAISDLEGSTALGEKLDPESLFGILALYFDAMRLIFGVTADDREDHRRRDRRSLRAHSDRRGRCSTSRQSRCRESGRPRRPQRAA